MEKFGSDEHVQRLQDHVMEKYAGFKVTPALCDAIADELLEHIRHDFPEEAEPIVKVAQIPGDPSHVDITIRRADADGPA